MTSVNTKYKIKTKVILLKINYLDQHGRRQSIRLNNVKLEGSRSLEYKVLEILKTAVPSDENFIAEGIERCHPVSKHNKQDRSVN